MMDYLSLIDLMRSCSNHPNTVCSISTVRDDDDVILLSWTWDDGKCEALIPKHRVIMSNKYFQRLLHGAKKIINAG